MCEPVPSVTIWGTTQLTSSGTYTTTLSSVVAKDPITTTLTTTVNGDETVQVITTNPLETSTWTSVFVGERVVTSLVAQQTLYYPCSATATAAATAAAASSDTAAAAVATSTSTSTSTSSSSDSADVDADTFTTPSTSSEAQSSAANQRGGSITTTNTAALSAESGVTTSAQIATGNVNQQSYIGSSGGGGATSSNPTSGGSGSSSSSSSSSGNTSPNASSSSSSSDRSSSSSSSNSKMGVIVGSVIGALAALMLLAFAVLYYRKRQYRRQLQRLRQHGTGAGTRSRGEGGGGVEADYWERRFRALEADAAGVEMEDEDEAGRDGDGVDEEKVTQGDEWEVKSSRKLHLTLDLASRDLPTRPPSRLSAISSFFSSKVGAVPSRLSSGIVSNGGTVSGASGTATGTPSGSSGKGLNFSRPLKGWRATMDSKSIKSLVHTNPPRSTARVSSSGSASASGTSKEEEQRRRGSSHTFGSAQTARQSTPKRYSKYLVPLVDPGSVTPTPGAASPMAVRSARGSGSWKGSSWSSSRGSTSPLTPAEVRELEIEEEMEARRGMEWIRHSQHHPEPDAETSGDFANDDLAFDEGKEEEEEEERIMHHHQLKAEENGGYPSLLSLKRISGQVPPLALVPARAGQALKDGLRPPGPPPPSKTGVRRTAGGPSSTDTSPHPFSHPDPTDERDIFRSTSEDRGRTLYPPPPVASSAKSAGAKGHDHDLHTQLKGDANGKSPNRARQHPAPPPPLRLSRQATTPSLWIDEKTLAAFDVVAHVTDRDRAALESQFSASTTSSGSGSISPRQTDDAAYDGLASSPVPARGAGTGTTEKKGKGKGKGNEKAVPTPSPQQHTKPDKHERTTCSSPTPIPTPTPPHSASSTLTTLSMDEVSHAKIIDRAERSAVTPQLPVLSLSSSVGAGGWAMGMDIGMGFTPPAPAGGPSPGGSAGREGEERMKTMYFEE